MREGLADPVVFSGKYLHNRPMDETSGLMERRRRCALSDRLAIEAGEGRCTHRELALRSAAVARALLGPRRSLDGARVALLARPSVDRKSVV